MGKIVRKKIQILNSRQNQKTCFSGFWLYEVVVFVFLIVFIAHFGHFCFLHFSNWRIFKKVVKNGHFLTKKWEFLKRSVSGADFLHPGVFDSAEFESDVIFDVGVRPEGVNGRCATK